MKKPPESQYIIHWRLYSLTFSTLYYTLTFIISFTLLSTLTLSGNSDIYKPDGLTKLLLSLVSLIVGIPTSYIAFRYFTSRHLHQTYKENEKNKKNEKKEEGEEGEEPQKENPNQIN